MGAVAPPSVDLWHLYLLTGDCLVKSWVRKFLEIYDLSLADYQGDLSPLCSLFPTKIQPDLRPVCPENLAIITDIKLQVFDIHEDLSLVLKGQTYNLAELENAQLADQDGLVLVFRLGSNLHRYLAIESG